MNRRQGKRRTNRAKAIHKANSLRNQLLDFVYNEARPQLAAERAIKRQRALRTPPNPTRWVDRAISFTSKLATAASIYLATKLSLGCGGGDASTIPSDFPPAAYATYSGDPSPKNEGEIVFLDGTGSTDAESPISTYSWSQVSGPTATLDNPTSPTPTFIAPRVDGQETLEFMLTVEDSAGQPDSDVVPVTINDTSRIAATNLDNSVYIEHMRPDGSDLQTIATGALRPRWLPTDQNTTTFHAFGDIWKIQRDGTGLTNLTNTAGVEEEAAFSPDGTKVVYRDDSDRLYIADFDGSSISNPVELAANGNEKSWPVFSPVKDGADYWIYYSENIGGTDKEICRIRPDGTGREVLTSSSASDVEPDVSKDKLSFSSNRSGRFQIYTSELDGSSPVQVTNILDNAGHPSFSDTGRKLTYMVYDGPSLLSADLHTINTDGTGDTTISGGSNRYISPDWSD